MSLAPVMLKRDREDWMLLLGAAMNASRPPYANFRAEGWRRAGDVAAKAVLPDQAPEKAKPFMGLLRFAAMWPRLDRDHREANAAAVRRLAQACADILGADLTIFTPPDPPPPEPPPAAAQRLPYRDDTFEEDAA